MIDDGEVDELCQVYREMNESGKEKMVAMAKELLTAQLPVYDNALYSSESVRHWINPRNAV